MPSCRSLPPTSSGILRPKGIQTRVIGRAFPLLLVFTAVIAGSYLWSWDSKPHSQIVDATVNLVFEKDHLPQRLGIETWRLRYYVQMADWRDCFVSAADDWSDRTQDFGKVYAQFYADDYLLFPAAPYQLDHAAPGAYLAYRPFFLRSLQALRTESPANAARWIGSLLHFVTDSGSPPHVLLIHGDLHVKMEGWLDASRIDLTGYDPQLLGPSDEEAAQGLVQRMTCLIEFSTLRAKRMLPFAQANDRPHVEPIGLECATECSKVSADVIHTLMALTGKAPEGKGASLIAEVSAPQVAGMDVVPAKLILLGTNYSTLSELSAIPSNTYRGSFWPSSSFSAESENLVKESSVYRGNFSFRNLPPGTYQGVVERIGARPLFVGPLVLRPGPALHLSWQLQPSDPPGNIIRNPDFRICWAVSDAPDHWLFDKPHGYWLSGNTPVDAGTHYRAGYQAKGVTVPSVRLQWMEAHWKALNTPLVELSSIATKPNGVELVAPPKATFARCIVDGAKSPADSVQGVFLTRAQ